MNTEQETQVVSMLIDGTPQKNIAKSVGVCQATISGFKNRADIKGVIETCQRELISRGAQGAVENHINIIEIASEIIAYLKSPTEQQGQEWFGSLSSRLKELGILTKDILTLADKKEKRVGQSAGFFVAHSQSPVTVNILNQQTNIINDPVILNAVERYANDDLLDIDLGFDRYGPDDAGGKAS